jgi:RNA polymerase sigma-70 factor (ECF subfamily)
VFLAVLEKVTRGEQPSDAALMESLTRERDVNALEQLYDRYSRLVYSLVLRMLQQAASAEEIVQDVFLQLWRNAHLYDASRGPLQPWLLTLARNRSLDFLRLKREKQRRREDVLEDFPAPLAVAAPNFDAQIDEQRRAARVRELMHALPAPQLKAIELAFFEGLSHSEIAAAMQQPLGTVKSWIRNGLLRLKEGLGATP